ncbi:BLUF domain-containing protein [Mucilaginibacter sp.]|uniref:BLUF domain-containing protein n=1 Tax=Mucilaginibacter sp. TaxID=1882438 RepID=UPI0035BC61E0
MQYICYVSAATAPLSGEELNKIVNTSRTNNKRDGITGIMLYSEGTFMQVLEGEKKDINAAFERINKDNRHTGVVKLAQGEISERHFGQWPMAFKKTTAKEFSKFSDFSETADPEIAESGLHPSVLLLKDFFEKTGMYLAMGLLLSFVK